MTTERAARAGIDPSRIQISREIACSDASTIFEVDLDGQKCLMKVFHDNGDPGYTARGRDLNRFRCEFNAYEKLFASGVCDSGFVPKYYGYIDRLDPATFYPHLQHFARNIFKPNAILFEYFPDAESLSCVNYSEPLFSQAIEGLKAIHNAGVHHRDIYPKNILVVRGPPDRLVWIDFDVSTTFTDDDPDGQARCEHEVSLMEGLGQLLKDDQAEGIPPNTKFY